MEESKEAQYMIAMIVLAGVCGVLLIAFIIACCCCQRYQRKFTGGGSGTRFGKQGELTAAHWPVTSCEGYGSPYQGGSRSSCSCQGSGSCSSCRGHASAYDWALPTPHRSGIIMSAASNPYALTSNPYALLPSPCAVTAAPQMKTGNEYGRVLLNPPSAVCTKPKMASTQLAGSCGTGGGCDGKFYSSAGQPLASSAAQFVLESGSKHF